MIGNIDRISLLKKKGIDRSLRMLKTNLSSRRPNSEILMNNRSRDTIRQWTVTKLSCKKSVKSIRRKLNT